MPANTIVSPTAVNAIALGSGATWQSGSGGKVSDNGLVAEYCCAGAQSTVFASSAVRSGKHYVELTISVRHGASASDTWTRAGVVPMSEPQGRGAPLPDTRARAIDRRGFADGDVVMMALDMDGHAFHWGINGRWHSDPAGSAGARLEDEAYRPYVTVSASSTKATAVGDRWIANFGARPFKYEVPPGFGAYAAGVKSPVAAPATARDDPYLNRFFADAVTVAGVSVPLPAGRWQGMGHVAEPGQIDDTVVLGRIAGDELTDFIAIRVQKRLDGQGFDAFASCDRNDLYAKETARNVKGGEQLCWWVNHATDIWSAPAYSLAQSYLAAVRVRTPATMINSGFRKADAATAVTAFYFVNPKAAGFSDASTPWKDSAWQRDKVVSDPQRLAYLDQRVQWTRDWMPIFKAVR